MMKLDTDCVRDLLLTLEEESVFDERFLTKEISLEQMCAFPRMTKYTKAVVLYVSQKLNEGQYIDFTVAYIDDSLAYSRYGQLLMPGHQFLEKIRSDTVWKTTRAKAVKIGSFSLAVLENIAAKVIADLLTR